MRTLQCCGPGAKPNACQVGCAVPAPLQKPLTFEHVVGWERPGASKTNPKQAEAVIACVRSLLKANEVGAGLCASKQLHQEDIRLPIKHVLHACGLQTDRQLGGMQ